MGLQPVGPDGFAWWSPTTTVFCETRRRAAGRAGTVPVPDDAMTGKMHLEAHEGYRQMVEKLMHSFETARIVVFNEDPFHMLYVDKGNLTSTGVNTSALRYMARHGLVVTQTGHRHFDTGQHAPSFEYQHAVRGHDEFDDCGTVPMDRKLSTVEVRTLDAVEMSGHLDTYDTDA